MNRNNNFRTFVIAEMACSHDGSVDLAKDIIRGAGVANADAVQFQMWNLDENLTPDHADFDLCRSLEFTPSQWKSLGKFLKEEFPTLEIIACVSEPSSVEVAEEMGVEAYKLHTSELSNPVIIERVAQTGKRIDLSIGASSLDEIQRGLERIRAISTAEIWLMYGYQNFPTAPADVNLAYLATLKELFDIRVGYQDHTDADHPGAFWLPAAAHGMGIDVQEKHITHDRSKKGCDHQAALNPSEFNDFVGMVRLLDESVGDAAPRPYTDGEIKYRKYAKKSLVAARNIAEGSEICGDDLKPMRASSLGIPPDEAQRLVGRCAKRAIKLFEPVLEQDVQ